MRHHRKAMSGLASQQQGWKKEGCVTKRAVMLKAETDNIWSCRKIWFHSFNSLNHLWPWRAKTQSGGAHTRFVGVKTAAASEQKSELMSKQLQSQRLLLHSESNGLKNILQSVRALKLQLKCCWVPSAPPPLFFLEEISFGQRMIFFHQWQPSEGHWPSVLSAKSDMKHLRLLKAVSTSKHRWEEFLKKWENACLQNEQFCSFFFACSISCTCRCGLCLGNGLTVAHGWTNKRKTKRDGQDLNILSIKTDSFPSPQRVAASQSHF